MSVNIVDLYTNNATKCLEEGTARYLNDDSLESFITVKGISFYIHVFRPTIKPHKPVKIVKVKEPLLPPYPKYKLCEFFNNTHYIFINKQMVCKGHVVISASSKEQHQTDPLTIEDCTAINHVLNGFNGQGIAYYNCGEDAGCSQIHKHMQFVPLKGSNLLEKMAVNEKMPFVYHMKHIESYEPKLIFDAYVELMKLKETRDYNFICANNSVIIVPRREKWNEHEVVVNSLGFCGRIMSLPSNTFSVRDDPMKTLVCTGVENKEY